MKKSDEPRNSEEQSPQPHTDAKGTPLPRTASARDAGRGAGGEAKTPQAPNPSRPAGEPRRRSGPNTVRQTAHRDKVHFAREQRRDPTETEVRLWQLLRSRKQGPKFRRQHPFGDFVLDFYCEQAKLAIEIDGPHHERQPRYDRWRDQVLQSQGIAMLRLAEADVHADTLAAVQKIVLACADRTEPHP